MTDFLQSSSSKIAKYENAEKRMEDHILQTILDNTTKTRDAVNALQDGLARIEVTTEQNKRSIDHLDRIVWRPDGENLPLAQAYVEQSTQLRELAGKVGKIDSDLTLTIRKVEGDLKQDIQGIVSKLDSRNSIIVMILITLLAALLGAGATYLAAERGSGTR